MVEYRYAILPATVISHVIQPIVDVVLYGVVFPMKRYIYAYVTIKTMYDMTLTFWQVCLNYIYVFFSLRKKYVRPFSKYKKFEYIPFVVYLFITKQESSSLHHTITSSQKII